jgi:hypothetical protein
MEEGDPRIQFSQSLIGGEAGKPDHQRDVMPGPGIRWGGIIAHDLIVLEPPLPESAGDVVLGAGPEGNWLFLMAWTAIS